ncbi:MAG: cytochrome c oxidase subunit II [Alteromonadaceae bacterium]|jgi:cytochrome c oxidase subunit 2|uniref:Cytochrome c oxidase subunit 2 n=3 Tax=Paraglaciecola chathamensis TaxID=368405 RepID=A0ABS0WDZ3_9ALTE|nr:MULTISPECIES: cytochrome c oxidase subunit II [Paraglaciecola]AEE25129.1 cytochrome c oxidase, subunit II [Glaciecola sp. 4H-3-7+YE-5]MBN27591.1 cytochrome c oxidase subunit II [Alteromonadaceae bacterium]MBJ2136690.1 cytochrome c oxidase subunit II [Paraglaciecola chathamensis]MBU3017733.1 cytochrome c oxidase subunit II [Paraglaciecola agarilytica]MDO6840294.1 cytochrome c oxidase subunit II [Paraglaciecola chathamensis]|tara:strand:- start:65368 stop:66498 length:1131 start_codon:yes stop_codon:yes gene_type:complete
MAMLGVFQSGTTFAESVSDLDQYQLNMRRGVTDISAEVYDLHMLMFIICVVIAVGVFGAMFYSILFHRKSRGAKPANFHESVKVEIAWTVVPFIILIVMAIPAAKTLIAMEDASEPDVTVLVTGSQWKWHYKYMDNDVEFFSRLATQPDEISGKLEKGVNYLLEVDQPLVIPTDKRVRFLITSDDVIHSWWVPDFAVKQDANPGFINDAWAQVNEPGIYRGQCAELCGKDHGFMPVVVIAKEPAEYDKWIGERQAIQEKAKAEEQRLLAMNMSKEELMSNGQKIYTSACAACHMPNGEGLPGVFPALKGSDIALNDMATHIDIVLNGKTGTAMAAFAKQLTMSELAAVITYERNAWGNDTGDLVQAKDINAALNGQ